jgi:transposase
VLKAKKGFSITTKSVKAKLERNLVNLQETKDAYNEVVHFYFLLIAEDPTGLTIPKTENGGWRYYEIKTFDDKFIKGLPSPFKRAAIRQAIGAYESWHSNHQRWLKRPRKMKHHKPPVHPRKFNFNPQYDSGMWKEDDGVSIVLKALVNGEWKWIKHQYQSPGIEPDWVKCSPRVQVQGNSFWLVFPIEKYVPATGGIKKIMSTPKFRTCGIDMDLDKHIAICIVLETNDRGESTEVARFFINQSRHVARRKRNLGRIAIKMNKTGIISRGFASQQWQELSRREVEFSRDVSRLAAEFARHWQVQVISFEHLGNLRPQKGKYSRRSNQKRAYWLKSKVYEQVKRIAFQDYGMLVTRVNPKNTSKLSPDGIPVWRGNHFPGSILEFLEYQSGANLVATPDGYKAHSGLNAARNIALKAIKRNLPEATLNLKSLER